MFGKAKKIDTQKVWRVIFVIWIAFATIYVVYSEYSRLNNYVFEQGKRAAVQAIVAESEKCQPVPIYIGGQQVASLLNVGCLQAPPVEGEAE